ncbi:MAG: DEAD/DEAH box helicase [Actinomycetota bacterium]
MSKSFTDLGVSNGVARTLEKRGIAEPFEVQARVLPDAIAGRDVLVRSRTGSGKTLAFAIPIVERVDRNAASPSALILTPTRELASQVANELRDIASAKNLRVAVVYGGVSIREQQRAVAKANILVATPGRLEDLVNRRMVSLGGITILVLDEADHMLDMGFAPQVEKLVERIRSERQTMLFSATLDGEVGRIARRYTHQPVSHEIDAPPAAQDVEHRFVAVGGEQKVDKLASLLLKKGAGSTLVFVRTKHGADRLAKSLSAHGIRAAAMHGNKSQSQRESALASFASGRVAALVATDVAARGIDVRNVAQVVNFDAPTDDKSFVHRVGRTGRAGATGISITFVAPHERVDVGRMASRLRLEKEFSVEHGFVREERGGQRRNSPQGRRQGPGGRPAHVGRRSQPERVARRRAG